MLLTPQQRADKKLIRAIGANDLDGARAALAIGADPNVRKNSNSALLLAVFAKNPDLVRLLVRAGAQGLALEGTRDPITETLRISTLPVVAALLDVPATAQAVAACLHDAQHPRHKGAAVCSYLLREDSTEVLGAFFAQGKGPYSLERWWQSAMRMHQPHPESLRLMERTIGPPTQELVRLLAKERPGPVVLDAFARHHLLTFDVLFVNDPTWNTPQWQPRTGLLGSYARWHSAKATAWLIDYAHQLLDGRQHLQQAMPDLILPILGSHANLGLTKKLLTRAGMVLNEAILARDRDGKNVFHYLLGHINDSEKRLTIAKMALEAGVDPLHEDKEGQRACLGALCFTRKSKELFDLFLDYGVDWTGETIPWEAQLHSFINQPHVIISALVRMERHNRDATHAQLENHSPAATRKRAGLRL